MSRKARVVRREPRTWPPAPQTVRVGFGRYRSGFRPEWHKIVGVLVFAAGAALFFVCEFNGWHLHEHGGHVWYLVGIAIVVSSSWWFGLFDRALPHA